MNLVEGLVTQTWFGKIQVMLSTMLKLSLLIFGNDKIQMTSTLLKDGKMITVVRRNVEIQYHL